MLEPVTAEQAEYLAKELRRAVQTVRTEIRDELLRLDDELYIDIAGRVHDIGEESVADLLADQNIAQIGRQVEKLREIEKAIARLSSGSYGVCVECGNPIGWQRLKAIPSASRCLECQDRVETQVHSARFPKL